MDFIVKKSSLNGIIAAPPSKSQTMRAILFASLAKGKSVISNYLHSPDTDAMIEACIQIGGKIEKYENHLVIIGNEGKIKTPSHTIDAGNSGIVLRFITALCALQDSPATITGDHSICNQRPMQPLLSALQQLSVNTFSHDKNGFAPITVQGPWNGNYITLNGEDSQPVSALLIASAIRQTATTIEVQNPGEKPWIDMTLSWLDRIGIKYKNREYSYYQVFGNQKFAAFNYYVPGDWSSAAFPIAAALITRSDLTISNLDFSDSQGDKKIIDCLKGMGAVIDLDHQKKEVYVSKNSELSGKRIDLNDMIDALPILGVLGCFAQGKTDLINCGIAKTKECDRLACLTKELKKMGAKISHDDNSLSVSFSSLKGSFVESHKDHRLAMALAMAGLGSSETTTIHSVECTSKTYRNLSQDFQSIGASIETILP